MSQEKTILLHTYNDILVANIAQDKLKAMGIESYLENENVAGLNPIGGVELRVFIKDREAAEKILAES
ncbi:MAG: DUF2007 domain-containing protein [Chitinophagaceae bacterium]|nr:DUF2007 domain-containing protein [Chitinophagaceae bacterium]